jgi:hypothetical protein
MSTISSSLITPEDDGADCRGSFGRTAVQSVTGRVPYTIYCSANPGSRSPFFARRLGRVRCSEIFARQDISMLRTGIRLNIPTVLSCMSIGAEPGPAVSGEQSPNGLGATFRVAFPVERYLWESHLDRSMPEGARGQILAPWIMDDERLRLSPHCPNLIESAAGETIGWCGQERNNSGLVVSQDWFSDFLRRANLECVWITVGERQAWDEKWRSRRKRRSSLQQHNPS